MIAIAAPTEPTVERRVFEAWSIQVPAAFAETFVEASTRDSWPHIAYVPQEVPQTSP